MTPRISRRSFAFSLFAAGLGLLVLAAVAPGKNPRMESASLDSVSPAVALGTDVNVITGSDAYPRVTQSESSSWGHGNTVVVAYNDTSGETLSPPSTCGVSVSTDGGATFTRVPFKFNTTGACYGGPSVFYSVKAAKWFVSFLSSQCSSRGIALPRLLHRWRTDV